MEPEVPVEPEAPVAAAPVVEDSASVTAPGPEMPRPSDFTAPWTAPAAPVNAAVAQAVHTAAPVYTPAPAPARKSSRKTKHNAGRIVLSVFLSILLCVSLLVSTLVTVVKFTVTPERFSEIVTDLFKNPNILGSLVQKTGSAKSTAAAAKPHTAVSMAAFSGRHAAVSLSAPELDLSDLQNMDDLADYLYDLAKDQPGWEDTSRRKIKDALDSPVVEEFLNGVSQDLAEDYTSVILEGKESEGLDLTEKLTDYIMDHENEVEDLARDAGFTGEMDISRRKLEQAIRDNVPEEIASLTPEKVVEKLDEQNEKIVSSIRLVFSPWLFYALWALTALLIVLLIVVNRHRISAVLYCVGIPALILGLIFLAGWCTMQLYPGLKEGPLSLIPTYLGKTVLLTGAGLTGGGALFVIIKLIIGAVQKKKA